MNLNIEQNEITLRENEVKKEENRKNDIEPPIGSSITSLVNISCVGILQ